MILKPIFENMPDEIKVLTRCVNWKAIERDGKVTKPPYQPDGKFAETNNPLTWNTFDAVKAAANHFDGIGFVLTNDDEIVALDFDDCRCPAFDGVTTWANSLDMVLTEIADMIRPLDTYTEISPSRKGIRVLIKGTLPLDGKRKGKIEAYQNGRYVTLTGHVLDGFPRTIENRQAELDSFYDAAFGQNKLQEASDSFDSSSRRDSSKNDDFIEDRKQAMFLSKNGADIKRLWDGDYSAYESQSEGDLALCSHLAFWLGKDVATIDQAFRASKLMRPKWDEKHRSDKRTYGRCTIDQAVVGCKSTYGDRQTSSPIDWKDPTPLPQGIPSVRVLDAVLIPEPFRGWLTDIAERMQIPPDFSAVAAIVAAGSLIGRRCGIYPKRKDDWMVIPNLWGGVIGRPSLMKSPAISEAHKHIDRLEAEKHKEHREAMIEFEAEKQIADIMLSGVKDKLKKAVKCQKNGEIESLIGELNGVRPEEPVRVRYQTQDATTEKIGDLLTQNPHGILINRDELTGWLKTLDKVGREGDRGFFLEAWNGNRRFTYDRIGRGTIEIEALCLSVFGAMTPGALTSYVQAAVGGGGGDDGLLQRFQMIVWPDAQGEWSNVDRFPNTIEKNRAWEIFKKLSTLNIEKHDPDDGIPALRFSDKGQDVFDQWRSELETRMRGDHGLSPALESHLIKYRKLMPALALIYHLIDYVDGQTQSLSVSEQSAIMAAAWCQYLETHAMRIYGVVNMPPGLDAAREIAKHIKHKDIKNGMSIREIWRPQWSKLTTSDGVKSGFEVLQDYGWLVLEKATTGGRPSESVRLNPRLKF